MVAAGAVIFGQVLVVVCGGCGCCLAGGAVCSRRFRCESVVYARAKIVSVISRRCLVSVRETWCQGTFSFNLHVSV